MKKKSEQFEIRNEVNEMSAPEQKIAEHNAKRYTNPDSQQLPAVTPKEETSIPQVIQNYINRQEGNKLVWKVEETSGDVILTVKQDKSKEADLLSLFGSLPVDKQSEKSFNKIREEARIEKLEEWRKKGEI